MEQSVAAKVPVWEHDGLPAVSQTGLRVLVVEDDEVDAFLIRTALSRNPRVCEIAIAKDGVEALEWLDGDVIFPDIALIDLMMPRKNGFGLLSELQFRPWATFPKIILTSSIAKTDRARSILRGADCFLSKPNTIDEFGWMLSHAFAKF